MKPRYISIFEKTEEYSSLPCVDISSLMVEQDSEAATS